VFPLIPAIKKDVIVSAYAPVTVLSAYATFQRTIDSALTWESVICVFQSPANPPTASSRRQTSTFPSSALLSSSMPNSKIWPSYTRVS
jgi:hypothetical protein